jgi:hypothetical protein
MSFFIGRRNQGSFQVGIEKQPLNALLVGVVSARVKETKEIILLARATTDVGCKEMRIHRLALLERVQLPPNKLRQGFLSNNSLYGQAGWYRLFPLSLSLLLLLLLHLCDDFLFDVVERA